ncbi:probable protein phosphatase 2C 33 isoform X2 [Lycium barbarum]|uniref:probable protein phosphatase 2C 33 isoform X2 n=1 Tax=Lycium barbarum TaxID=112863 RepID=UPI00293F5DEE|nr:probable protein phosphatase 2C 33 isoform X2 [Lycium barbarum]
MGSCFSLESRSPVPGSPVSTTRTTKRRSSKNRLGGLRNSSFDYRKEEQLQGIPGRMFLNGSSEVASLFTQQGKKGPNQDAMIVWENFVSRTDTIFCGVFDGHGPYGHFVAKRVRDSLPLKLRAEWEDNIKDDDYVRENSPNTRSSLNSEDASFISADEESKVSIDVEDTEKHPEVFQTLKDSFLKAYKFIYRELSSYNNINCFCSGTTAVTLVKQGQDLVIGNVGDSRAVLAMKDKDGSLMAVQLTVDLKPNLPEEAERIRKCKGRVFALRNEPEVARVWLPSSNSPGLAMACAFGDFCLKDFGLISVPEISYRPLTENDQFIVLATDGLDHWLKQLYEAGEPNTQLLKLMIVLLFASSLIQTQLSRPLLAVRKSMIRLFQKAIKFQKKKTRKFQIERRCFQRRRMHGLRLMGFLGPTHY